MSFFGLVRFIRTTASVVGLVLLLSVEVGAESASFLWSPGCAIVESHAGRAGPSSLYRQSEQEARSVCNAKGQIFVFGPNTLASCEIALTASPDSEGWPFEYRISPAVATTPDILPGPMIAFCRARPAEIVRYHPGRVSAPLKEAIRRSPALRGYELVVDAPWDVFSAQGDRSVTLVPVRWWDHDRSGEDPYLERWKDRVPYVRLVLIRKETKGDARLELVGRVDADLQVRNVVDVDGDGYPEADYLMESDVGWEYSVSSFHPRNVDRQTLWFTYRSADWVRVGQ